jgi:hypothetical protein
LSALRTRCTLLPRNIIFNVSGTHFCQRESKPQGLVRPKGFGKLILHPIPILLVSIHTFMPNLFKKKSFYVQGSQTIVLYLLLRSSYYSFISPVHSCPTLSFLNAYAKTTTYEISYSCNKFCFTCCGDSFASLAALRARLA